MSEINLSPDLKTTANALPPNPLINNADGVQASQSAVEWREINPADAVQSSKRLLGIEVPWIVLAALLLATFLSAYQSKQQTTSAAEARFQEIAAQAAEGVSEETRHIESMMRLASVVIASSPTIDGARWNQFLDTQKNLVPASPGLVRLEYRSSIKDASGSGASSSDRPIVLPPSLVRNIDPSQTAFEFNFLAFATDAIADAMRRAKLSRQSTTVISTNALNQAAPSLAVIVSPVYATFVTQGSPIGYILGYVRPNILVETTAIALSQRLAIAVSHSGSNEFSEISNQSIAAAGKLVGTDKDSSIFNTKLAITIAQSSWVLDIHATPLLINELSSNAPTTILTVGILGAFFLAGMLWLLTRLREQAAALAKSMTTKLRDQVKFTDDLIELNPNPIYRKDAAGRFVVVNRAWEQLHERSRANVIGKTTRDFAHPSMGSLAEEFDEDVVNSVDGFVVREAHVVTADGRRIPTLLAKQLVRRADGSPDGIIGTLTDMTEINQLQREVAKQREQLDLVIRSSQQGIFDIEINPTGNVYYSEMFREILGYVETPIENVVDWKEVIHPEDRDIFRHGLVAHIKKILPFLDVECRAFTPDKRQIWLRIRGVMQYDDFGTPRRLVGSVVDVSERRVAEKKLIDANILVVEAAKAKEAFLATMSHEIRTPMNGVLGMAGLLAETDLNDEQQDYIRLIRASGDTLLRLINDVLDFSKIESGHMTLEAVSVEFCGVIEEAIELVADKAREKKIALVCDIDRSIPPYILGDATRLSQILMNLLSNAIKFTNEGEIFIAATLQQKSDGKIEITVSVTDTGIGIPPERVAQLFQPFTQVDASTTRKYGGTGLGLAIVKRLVQMMGGNVSLTSVLNAGSVFSFSILTQPARGPLRPYMQFDIPEFIGKRLLFVDASLRLREAVAKRYRGWGLSVTTSPPNDAARTLLAARLRGEPFDLLMTDTVEASVDGTAIAEFISVDDKLRLAANNLEMMMVILMSDDSRAELAKLSNVHLPRHDFLLIRPTSRMRIFDVLMQALTRLINHDMATRPFTQQPRYDENYTLLRASRESRRLVSLANVISPVTASDAPVPNRTAPNGQSNVVSTLSAAAASEIHSLNILVAEDNEINQQVIKGMLRKLGHNVTIVADGLQAVQRVAEQADAMNFQGVRFDFVMMDIHMPVLDGVAATHAIKELFNHPDPDKRIRPMPIVAMTANALAGDREHYLAAGLDDYISKPLRADALLALLIRAFPDRPLGDSKVGRAKVVDEAPSLQTSGSQYIEVNEPAPLPPEMDALTYMIPVLDMEQLEDLIGLPSGIDGDTTPGAHGLIDLFKTKSRERLRLMSSCLVDSNWLLLGDTAHSLRGAAASIGFPRVAEVCKSLELATRRLTPKAGMPMVESDAPMPTQKEVDEMYEKITLHFYEAETALAKWLAATTANKQLS